MRAKAGVHNSIGEQQGIPEAIDLGPFTPLLPHITFISFALPRRTGAVH